MRDRPEDFSEERLRQALSEFGVSPSAVAYAPVGFGDYHWEVTGDDGRRWFVTVSDLEHKEHCGPGPAAALDGLRQAMDTALALRERAGLRFAVAPLATADGSSVVALDARYAVTVFPHVPGRTGEFGQRLDPAERDQVLAVLAALHGATPPETTPPTRVEPPGLPGLRTALTELDAPWTGGPCAEPARALLVEHQESLRARLARFADLAARVRRRGAPLVVTHGEPHPGNLILGADGFLLVDWDTVGLALPERDLSLLMTDPTAPSDPSGPSAFGRYTELTGRTPDADALALYRLRWSLLDVAEFVAWFRAEHQRTEDTESAWKGFTATLDDLAAAERH
ncbi:phosphotransferase [Streptomyces sp. PmtG]